MRHGHIKVQKCLRAHGGELLGLEVSVEMCHAAATGDVLRIETLIENGANPNAGDYDNRTGSFSLRPAHPRSLRPLKCPLHSVNVDRCKVPLPMLTLKCSHARANTQPALHLAASNGQVSVLDYLMRHSPVHVNVNPADRTGGIPLVIFPASFSSSVKFTDAHREWENPALVLVLCSCLQVHGRNAN
jgi:ankyrin repeat protein